MEQIRFRHPTSPLRSGFTAGFNADQSPAKAKAF
jgi:hypothetical protein